MFGWKKTRCDKGTVVVGDNNSPPTRWWNHWFLALWGWRTVVTFRVSAELCQKGYRVGFIAITGESWLKQSVQHDEYFTVKIGHEDCEFYVASVEPPDRKWTLYLPEIVARGPLH